MMNHTHVFVYMYDNIFVYTSKYTCVHYVYIHAGGGQAAGGRAAMRSRQVGSGRQTVYIYIYIYVYIYILL